MELLSGWNYQWESVTIMYTARRKTVLSDLKLKVILRHNVKQNKSLFLSLYGQFYHFYKKLVFHKVPKINKNTKGKKNVVTSQFLKFT